jgi:nicotinate phosphoribosyltransferase
MHFARSQPENVTLLIDTYDTERGARKAVKAARELERAGIAVKAVRSTVAISRARPAARILDEGGYRAIRIFSSGSLDEYHCATAGARRAD